MPRMSKVELYAAIRRDHRDGMSMRELERKHGVTWRTVRKALNSSWPEPRKSQRSWSSQAKRRWRHSSRRPTRPVTKRRSTSVT
jgi:hypothetical protein